MSDTAPIRVLLAEDEAPTRELLVELLTKFGHAVVADVGSGAEALAQARIVKPDVMLLDVHMPDGSGVEVARQIATELPDVAVVLITADETLSVRNEDVPGLSTIMMLPKPTPPQMLDSQIRMAAQQARAFAQARQDATDLKAQLEARKVIERAKGILMRRTGCSEPEAYRILQRSSQDRSMPMVAIAQAVLDSEPGVGSRS
ncbi:ANTAR domain-containing response regulator [Roseisolibacter agri]|uniref:Fis family transcriptional regulator n=1 Tax=Roseisolibacter agri TaxID=2014610 RepID=A0AA37V1M7_9BACT|nr:ANTAR domain-containing protein [Roseisolibacter agri]GLC24027.1 Fis family transcriptional regulator [Roseisolibacter agri]